MPNIIKPETSWIDLYEESGIARGTAVNVQNQSGQVLYLRDNVNDRMGVVLTTYQTKDCTGTQVLEARSDGGISLFIQEL